MDTERTAENIDRLLRTAKLHQMRGNLDAASDACREAMGLDAENADVRDLLGDLLVAQGQLQPALEQYQCAFRLSGRPAIEEKVARLALRIEAEKQFGSPEAGFSATGIPRRQLSPSLATALSMLFPGLGQLYNGQYPKGMICFGVSLCQVLLIGSLAIPHIRAVRHALVGSARDLVGGPPVPSLLWVLLLSYLCVWLYALIDASLVATAINRGRGPGEKSGWEV